MLEANPTLPDPLSLRKPGRTFLVLLTPALTQPGRAGDAISKGRLYGWLIPAYKDPNNSLLRQHLPHRDSHQLAKSAERLGWASWEDCHSVIPAACIQPREAGDDTTQFDPVYRAVSSRHVSTRSYVPISLEG